MNNGSLTIIPRIFIREFSFFGIMIPIHFHTQTLQNVSFFCLLTSFVHRLMIISDVISILPNVYVTSVDDY